MTKIEYQEKLKSIIDSKGFWSKDVFNLNNKCIEERGVKKYLSWQEEVIYNKKYK